MHSLHAVRNRLDAPPDDPLEILQRLRAGWRPTRDNLADALVLEEWLLVPGVPYLLQGWDGHTLKSGMALAFDAARGWARRIDRWVVLGAPLGVPPRVSNDEVMRAAALALAGAAPADCAFHIDRHRGAEGMPPRPLPHHPACGSAPGGSMG